MRFVIQKNANQKDYGLDKNCQKIKENNIINNSINYNNCIFPSPGNSLFNIVSTNGISPGSNNGLMDFRINKTNPPAGMNSMTPEKFNYDLYNYLLLNFMNSNNYPHS